MIRAPGREPRVSTVRSPLRIAVVCHRHHLGGHQGHLYTALARRFAVTRVVVEDVGWPERLSELPERGDFDAIVWRVRFRELRHRPPFDWESYSGPRIMIDHDICRNYPRLWPEAAVPGGWPPVIRRQRFDLVLVSGKQVCELLGEEGVPAVWMPKAYDTGWLFDTGALRQGIGHYGAPYRARQLMSCHLRRSGVAVHRFQCPDSELNDHLNRRLGVVICNMGATSDDRNGRLRLTPAPEAMLKNFEVPAAGAAPICDSTPDLADLGFVDEHTAIVYATFPDLVDRLRAYQDRPDRLRDIGRRSAELVNERHTWDHRAAFLERLLRSPDPASSVTSWNSVTD